MTLYSGRFELFLPSVIEEILCGFCLIAEVVLGTVHGILQLFTSERQGLKKWFKYERTRNINLVRSSQKKVYFRVLVDVPSTRSFSFLFLTKMNDGGPLHFHYMKQKSGLMAPTLLRNVSNALDVFKVELERKM